ncbi:MAG: trwC8, partial [Pseudonocardiales bacterium]|nr:trwC8 [Pseudonocardiales bacterium]
PLLDHAIAAQPRVAAEKAASDAARARVDDAMRDLQRVRDQLAATEQAVARTGERIADKLRAAWDEQRADAQAAARRIQDGAARFGRGRSEITAAAARLEQWADTWQPILGDLRQHRSGLVGFAAQHPGNDHVADPLRDHAQQQAEAAHPELTDHVDEVTRAQQRSRAAHEAHRGLDRQQAEHAQRDDHLANPEKIERMRELVDASEQQLASSEQRLTALRTEPAVTSHPDAGAWLAVELTAWRLDRARREADDRARQAARHAHLDTIRQHQPWQFAQHEHGPSIDR